jgi:hypothetical protein
MSLLSRVVKDVADAIRKLVRSRRAEPQNPEPGWVPDPITEAELCAAMDIGANGLNWRQSIVDLQKRLGLPSDFEYRRWLAVDLDVVDQPLDYVGSEDQNIKLHKRVMDDVRAGGLPIPA